MKSVVVWGVHRSGTSLLTQGLERLGWTLGPVKRVATVENPGGYFEHVRVRELNERLFAALGSEWADARLCPDVDAIGAQALERVRDETAALLDALEQVGPWAIKDPRMTSLAEIWAATFAERAPEPAHVLIVRDPAEVALSQAARVVENPDLYRRLDRPEETAALWIRDMRSVASALARRDLDLLIVLHHDLATDAPAVFREILAFAENAEADPSSVSDLFQARYYRARGAAFSGPEHDEAGRIYRLIAERGARRIRATELMTATGAEPRASEPARGAAVDAR